MGDEHGVERSTRRRPERRRLRRWTVAGTALLPCLLPGLPAAEAAPLRAAGKAKVVSVDGPARLTVKTKQRTLKLRLIGVDTPQIGECGAAESVAELRRLVAAGRRKGWRYTLAERAGGPFTKDSEGRLLGWLSPGRSSWLDASIAAQLVASEWARGGDAVADPSKPLPMLSDWSSTYAGDEPWGERAAKGVWASCGGRMHLPLGAPVPPTEPAPWTVSADGVTEAIGPLTLSPTLSPATTLTVSRVAAVAPVEVVVNGDRGNCDVVVPSLQIQLTTTSAPKGAGCGTADIYAVRSTGPGRTVTSRGVGIGSTVAEATAAFPRLAGTSIEDGLSLTGPHPVPWAWRTSASVDESDGRIAELYATTGASDDD